MGEERGVEKEDEIDENWRSIVHGYSPGQKEGGDRRHRVRISH